MKSLGIPVFGTEAILPGQQAQTVGMSGWTQIIADPKCQVMFQKEALLNISEKNVPEKFTKLAWVDADLMFENKEWHKETSKLLEEFSFVQPFDEAAWTDIDGKKTFSKPSTFKMGGGLPQVSHPGFAMACRRSVWRSIGGLYNMLLLGSGDVATTVAVLGTEVPTNQLYSTPLMEHYNIWKAKVAEHTGNKYAAVKGIVWHDWHGEWKLRRYSERHKVSADLDPDKHIELGSNGLLSWTKEAPKWMRNYALNYFANRCEDGVPPKHILDTIQEPMEQPLLTNTSFTPGWSGFTSDWFTPRIPAWEKHIVPHFKGRSCKWLEIGSYEGRSAIWTVLNVLNHKDSDMTCIDPWTFPKVKSTFDSNIAALKEHLSTNGKPIVPIKVLHNFSQDILGKLTKESRDVIYIDGDHQGKSALTDAIMAWPILKKGGFMIFDDYRWEYKNPEDAKVKLPAKHGIDAFLKLWATEIKVVHSDYQVIIKKV